MQQTIEMKRADWEKWDAALRSGKYKQARQSLMTMDGYCCLGVLQHCLTGTVEVDEEGIIRSLPSREWLDDYGITFHGERAVYTNHPYLPSLDTDAVDANDEGFSFIALADAIKLAVKFTD